MGISTPTEFNQASVCYLRPLDYAVHPRYDATCFARRSTNGLRNFVAPLSVCLTAKAVRAKGKAPSRSGNSPPLLGGGISNTISASLRCPFALNR